MAHDQGVLHTVPIPEAMAYLMLRPLLTDVAEDDMCGRTVNQVFPANETLAPAARARAQRHPGRPGRRLGVVALRHDPQRRAGRGPAGLGQRHVHPRRALVPAQRGVRRAVREAFLRGDSPSDFPEEHYERGWPDRFGAEQLNETGRRGLGMS